MKKAEPKKRVTPPTVFTEEFKKKIISEYLESDLTKREILDKYGIVIPKLRTNVTDNFEVLQQNSKKTHGKRFIMKDPESGN